MKRLIPLLALAMSVSAISATPARLQLPVTYHPNAGVVDSVRNECQIEDMLGRRIGDAVGRAESMPAAEGETVLIDDSRLRIQITHVLGVGGGAWSGPKAITVQAEILEGGKTVRQTKITRWSVGGVFGAFKGTCTILERCANAITKDLVRWVRNPAFVIPAEAPPKDAPVATESESTATLPPAATDKPEGPVAEAASPDSTTRTE